MSATDFVIRYEFRSEGDATPTEFRITLDALTLANKEPLPATWPEWAALDFEQCPGCPLARAESPACPVAARLAGVVTRFAGVVSHQRVTVRVTVPERVYELRDGTVQTALSSLLGALMATAGCPVLGTLRPLVRFHLPFASELETVTRATSMYLLGQYLVAQRGGQPDWSLQGLSDSFRATLGVNRAFARRLRAAASRDASINALVRLDSQARSLPDLIESRLEELGFLFGL